MSPPQRATDKMTKPKKSPFIYPPTPKSFPHDDMTGDNLTGEECLFLCVPIYIIKKGYMDRITLDISELENGRISVIIFVDGKDKGVIHFERSKVGFVRKPVGMNRWVCVDARLWGLYDELEDVSPKDIMELCRREIEKKMGGESSPPEDI